MTVVFNCAGSIDACVLPEEIFLHRLLHSGAIESNGTSNGALTIEGALEQRQTSTLRLVENVVQAIEIHHTKNEDLSVSIDKATSTEGDCLYLFTFLVFARKETSI